ncbi:hypothetical protein ONZ45_g16880 [Pleurotus djamor]|nr:hypothetical protein ONZ45_g16880 [Pleurotus djamor]
MAAAPIATPSPNPPTRSLLLTNVHPPVRPSPPSPERWSTLSARLLAFSPGVLSFDSECRVGGDVVPLPYPLIDKNVLVSPYLIEEYMKTFQFAVHCFHDVHVRVAYRGGRVFLECALVHLPCPFRVNMTRAHQCADDTAEYFPRLQPFHVETNRRGCPTREGTWTAASVSSSQALDEDWIETDTDSDGTDDQDSDGESQTPAVYSNGTREPYIYVKPPYVPYGEHVPTPECLDAPYWCLYGDGVEHAIFERLFIKCPHCSLLLFGESYPTHTCNGQVKSPHAEVKELDGAQELVNDCEVLWLKLTVHKFTLHLGSEEQSEADEDEDKADGYFDLWEQGVAEEKCENAPGARRQVAVDTLSEILASMGLDPSGAENLTPNEALSLSASFAQYACATAGANTSPPPSLLSPSPSISSVSSYTPPASPSMRATASCPPVNGARPLRPQPGRSNDPRLFRVQPELPSSSFPPPPSPSPPLRPPQPFAVPWKVPRNYKYHVPGRLEVAPFYIVTKGYDVGVFSSWTRAAELVLGVSEGRQHLVASVAAGKKLMDEALARGTVYLVPPPNDQRE